MLAMAEADVEILGTDPERAWLESLSHRHEIHGAVQLWLTRCSIDPEVIDPIDLVTEIYRRHGADIDAGRSGLDQRTALRDQARRVLAERAGVQVDADETTPVIELPDDDRWAPASFRAVDDPGPRSARPAALAVGLAIAGLGLGSWLVVGGPDDAGIDELPLASEVGDAAGLERRAATNRAVVLTRGVLADGTDFTVGRPGPHREPVTAVLTMVGQTVADGVVEPTHVVSFALTGSGHPVAADVVGSGPGDDWRVRVDPLDPNESLYGSAKIDFIDALRPSLDQGMPTLDPAGSLAIVPDASLVRYETFAVRRGCPVLTVRAVCSQTNAVHVESTTPRDPTTVLSNGARPSTDSAWYDPGPLSPRADHAVMWTGEEMIVFGGFDYAGRPLTDGAAFDPTTDTWRPLAEAPEGIASLGAFWNGERVVVRSPGSIDSYWADTDTWYRHEGPVSPAEATPMPRPDLSQIAALDDAALPGRFDPERTVWTGSELLAWGVECCAPLGDPRFTVDAWRWRPPTPRAPSE